MKINVVAFSSTVWLPRLSQPVAYMAVSDFFTTPDYTQSVFFSFGGTIISYFTGMKVNILKVDIPGISPLALLTSLCSTVGFYGVHHTVLVHMHIPLHMGTLSGGGG